MAKYNLLPTYLEEVLSSMKAHLEQINLFEIVGINHEELGSTNSKKSSSREKRLQ